MDLNESNQNLINKINNLLNHSEFIKIDQFLQNLNINKEKLILNQETTNYISKILELNNSILKTISTNNNLTDDIKKEISETLGKLEDKLKQSAPKLKDYTPVAGFSGPSL